LIERVINLDPDAWQRLSRLYSLLVYRWCRRAGLQDSDAADVVQEVFRAVAGGISRFRHDQPSDSFRGWLYTITKNKIHDHFRQHTARPDAVGGSDAQSQLLQIPDTLSAESDAGDEFDAASSIAHRALELVRGEFEERTWQAFLRTAVGGQAPAIVADDLEMSVGAVCTAKWRVLRRVRQELEGLL
jgi:RNA polymerase sigma-70 factor (ECF subfamily)